MKIRPFLSRLLQILANLFPYSLALLVFLEASDYFWVNGIDSKLQLLLIFTLITGSIQVVVGNPKDSSLRSDNNVLGIVGLVFILVLFEWLIFTTLIKQSAEIYYAGLLLIIALFALVIGARANTKIIIDSNWLFFLSGLLILIALANLMPEFGVLRLILVGIVLYGVSGAMWTFALFPGNEIDLVERIALALGLSLVLVPIITGYLNWVGMPISRKTIFWSVLVISTAGYLVYRIRVGKIQRDQSLDS